MKKYLTVLLTLSILLGCSAKETPEAKDFSANQEACLSSLESDKPIQACLELNDYLKRYLIKEKENNRDLDNGVINDYLNDLEDLSTLTNSTETYKLIKTLSKESLETVLDIYPTFEYQTKIKTNTNDSENASTVYNKIIPTQEFTYLDTLSLKADIAKDDRVTAYRYVDSDGIELLITLNNDNNPTSFTFIKNPETNQYVFANKVNHSIAYIYQNNYSVDNFSAGVDAQTIYTALINNVDNHITVNVTDNYISLNKLFITLKPNR